MYILRKLEDIEEGIVISGRPSTTSGSVCKNILWVEAFCKVTLNDCYQPESFLNNFTVNPGAKMDHGNGLNRPGYRGGCLV